MSLKITKIDKFWSPYERYKALFHLPSVALNLTPPPCF